MATYGNLMAVVTSCGHTGLVERAHKVPIRNYLNAIVGHSVNGGHTHIECIETF